MSPIFPKTLFPILIHLPCPASFRVCRPIARPLPYLHFRVVCMSSVPHAVTKVCRLFGLVMVMTDKPYVEHIPDSIMETVFSKVIKSIEVWKVGETRPKLGLKSVRVAHCRKVLRSGRRKAKGTKWAQVQTLNCSQCSRKLSEPLKWSKRSKFSKLAHLMAYR